MQNHQRRAQAEPTQRSELRAFQVIPYGQNISPTLRHATLDGFDLVIFGTKLP